MPLFAKVYSLSNPLKSLSVTVPGNITPIIVTLLSVQSKLSFTRCPHSAHRPKAFTLHFFTENSRNSFQLRKDREPMMTMTTSSVVWASCWHQTWDEGPWRAESGLWSPATRQWRGSPGQGRRPLLSWLFSLYLGQSRPMPYLAMGTWHMTRAQHEYKHQASTLSYNAPPPTQRLLNHHQILISSRWKGWLKGCILQSMQ